MQKKILSFLALALLMQVLLPCATCQARAQAEEGFLSRNGSSGSVFECWTRIPKSCWLAVAPASISDGAEVKVLGPHWIHDRSERHEWLFSASWNDHGAPPPNDPEFWNPKVRAPICFNPPAARTFVPIFLMKTKLVVAGKSKTEIVEATASALDKDELPSLERGAMCYMSSK